MRRLTAFVAFLCIIASLVRVQPPRSASAASPTSKVPLDYKAYDSWNALRGITLSDDGTWLAYALVPEDGDGVLVVRNLVTGSEIREDRGNSPVFTADSKYVVYAIRAKNDAIHRAERDHKKPEESPKSGLGILALATGTATTFERVASFKVP